MDLHRPTSTCKNIAFPYIQQTPSYNHSEYFCHLFFKLTSPPKQLFSCQSEKCQQISKCYLQIKCKTSVWLSVPGGKDDRYIYINIIFLSQQQNKIYFPDEEKHVLPCFKSVNKTGCGKKGHIVIGTTTPTFLTDHSLSCNCVKQGSKKLVEIEKHVFLWKSICRNIYQLLVKHIQNNILFLKARSK